MCMQTQMEMILMSIRLYQIYKLMILRCDKEKAKGNYKKHNISVCDEWKNDFETLKKWALDNGYKEDLLIDRINTFGNYEPSNCRWITKKENSRNRTDTVFVMYKGELHKLCELCDKHNIKLSVVYSRIRSGWEIEKALTTPIRYRASPKSKGKNYGNYTLTNNRLPNSLTYQEMLMHKQNK